MAYVLDGTASEGDGFTFAIANFALRAMHEASGLVDMTTVVAPNQGNQYLVPLFAPITYQDYAPNAAPGTSTSPGTGFGSAPGAAVEQTPALGQNTITATPAVAATAFDYFYNWTTSFDLASTLGAELGESYAEKVDQRVCAAFLSFKATPVNSNYSPTPADGFARPTELGAMELLPAGLPANTAGWTNGFSSSSVLELIRNVKQNYKVARLPGIPTIVLDSNGDALPGTVAGQDGSSLNRLLAELTGGAVSQSGGSNLSALGNELLATGKIESVYGCKVVFTTFLPSASRVVLGQQSASNVLVGSYFHDSALITVLKEGLQIKMGEKPGGLQMWLTGLAYMGAGVADPRRGGAINIVQA
jgi:hypothetical protein